jgi:hypothetical protein
MGGKMSKEEAEELFRKFLEYKMMWHKEDGFTSSYLLHQAINILGKDKVDELTLEIRRIWSE